MNFRYVASHALRLLPRRKLSQAAGYLSDLRLPPTLARVVIGAYARAYRVDMSDTPERDEPFESFDAFFTRPLRDEARPIECHVNELVSPSDGRLECAGSIAADGVIPVKGVSYRVGQLLGDEEFGDRLKGGHFAVVYLSPRDYHRVHSPVDGVVTSVRGIAGDQFPVNSLGHVCSPTLFETNKRVVLEVATQDFGPVAVVMVGALIVGRITVSMLPEQRDVTVGVHRIEPALPVVKGQELGAFHLGSTAVVCVGPTHRSEQCDIRSEGPIRMGQSLMRLG